MSIEELDNWENHIDPIKKRASRLILVRKELLRDDWAIHWFINQ